MPLNVCKRKFHVALLIVYFNIVKIVVRKYPKKDLFYLNMRKWSLENGCGEW